MTPTTTSATPTIDETTELAYGTLLVAEAEDGGYEPVGIVSTIKEARILAAQNLQNRMTELERGQDPMCPDRYVVWGNGYKGYRVLSIIVV